MMVTRRPAKLRNREKIFRIKKQLNILHLQFRNIRRNGQTEMKATKNQSPPLAGDRSSERSIIPNKATIRTESTQSYF